MHRARLTYKPADVIGYIYIYAYHHFVRWSDIDLSILYTCTCPITYACQICIIISHTGADRSSPPIQFTCSPLVLGYGDAAFRSPCTMVYIYIYIYISRYCSISTHRSTLTRVIAQVAVATYPTPRGAASRYQCRMCVVSHSVVDCRMGTTAAGSAPAAAERPRPPAPRRVDGLMEWRSEWNRGSS